MAEVHTRQDQVWVTVRDIHDREHVIFETGNLRCAPGKYRATGLECDGITVLSQPRRDGAQSSLRVIRRDDHAGSVQYILTPDRQAQIIQAFSDAADAINKISQGRPGVARRLFNSFIRLPEF